MIAWVNGHTHVNSITPHARAADGGRRRLLGDQHRLAHRLARSRRALVEVVDNGDGTLSLFATMIDHAGPADSKYNLSSTLALASLSRELAVNDPQADPPTGHAQDRNTELLVRKPADVA